MAIKEDDIDREIREERALVTQVEKKFDWIIYSGCSHLMTSDMNKFIKFKNHDGCIFRVGKNVAYHVIGIGSITLDGRTNTDDVYFFDGLKHNSLSVGQLVDKDYQLQFTEKTCTIKDKDGKMIGIGTRSKGNVFMLNPTKITFLVAEVDNIWLWHRKFYHINFDNILNFTSTFVVIDLPTITNPTNIVRKECILAKQKK